MEKALISLLMEEFADDSLEVDNFILQTTSKIALDNLSVLACFDESKQASHLESGDSNNANDPRFDPSSKPPQKKRKRGRPRTRDGTRLGPGVQEEDCSSTASPRLAKARPRGRPRGSSIKNRAARLGVRKMELADTSPAFSKRGRGEYNRRTRKLDPLPFEDLVELVIPRYVDADFKMNFGMSRTTFEELCKYITSVGPIMSSHQSIAYETNSVEKNVLMTLWILSSRESYSAVSQRFGITKPSLLGIFKCVCGSLALNQESFVHFPAVKEFENIANGFYQLGNFPGVIGAVGSIHIPIREPFKKAEVYINKEGSFSMQLQVVCDNQRKFLHIHTGCAGSLNNSEIFYGSPLCQKIESDWFLQDNHLIGDCSFPLESYLMVPFPEDDSTTEIEKKFNEKLAKTRRVVDITLKLLKQKFQRLKFVDLKRVNDIEIAIQAACTLYNYILIQENIEEIDETELLLGKDEFEVDITPQPCPLSEKLSVEALDKRKALAMELDM